MKYKSAQISLFLIISVILLVLGITAVTVFNSSSIFQGESATYRVQEFTNACLDQQIEYAFNEIGKKGGWYYSKPGLFYAQSDFDNELVERSQGFNHVFYEELDYWNYYDDNSNSMKYSIPSLDEEDDKYSIKNQVLRLIRETINEHCLQDYASFSDAFEIEPQLDKLNISATSFERDNIDFSLYLPLSVKERSEDGVNSMTTFQTGVENPIKTPYYIARDIVIAQQNTSFIERAYLDFLYNYQVAGDESMLPPFYEFRYGVADYNIVYSDEKKPLLQQIFNTHSNEVIITDLGLTMSQDQKVRFTQDSPLKSAQSYQKEHISSLEQSYLEEYNLFGEYQNYVAKLKYEPFHPISFSFSNGKGGGRVLMHDAFYQNLLIVPIEYTTYQAGYDLTLPTIYEISGSSENFENNNFVFNLPLEINIRNNNPVRNLLDSDIRTNSYEVDSSYTASYCSQMHMISEDVNLKVSTRNKFDEREPLEDVEISFSCSAQPSTVCSIKEFDTRKQFNSLEYTMQLPINCPNSQIEIKKDGYVTKVIDDISPSLENPITREVELYTPKTVDLLYSIGGDYSQLPQNQESILIFEPKNNPQYIEVIEFDSTTNMQNLNLTLVPDTYTITSFTFDNSTQIIPERPGKSCSWYEVGCEDIPPLESIELNGWVISNYNLENYEISFADLQFAETIEANMPAVKYPTTYDEFEDQEIKISEQKDIRIYD